MSEQRAVSPATATRWRIVALLAAFSLVSYALRTNISVAAALMRAELQLTPLQIGQVFSAFLVGYAIFQVPAGALGDKFGARLVLSVAAATWGVTTALTGALPGAVGGAAAALLVLSAIRFILGAAEAATYPVAAATVAVWMPPSERAFANSLVIAGMALGSACIPPVMSQLMVSAGWRTSFYATASLGFLMAALWWWYARDRPSQHRGVNDSERLLIAEGREPTAGAAAPREAPPPVATAGIHWPLLRNRNMLLISASYFLDSYVLAMFVYWFYLYLVDERGFGILQSGAVSSLPWIAALILVPLAGRTCDRVSARRGRRFGRRVVAMSALGLSSTLLLFGARTDSPMLAIAVLSLSVGFLMATEGPFWSGATDISGAHPGMAGGIMNTAGNLGGVAQATVVPLLVQRFGWVPALTTGSLLGLVSALLWLLIRVDEPDANAEPASPEGGRSSSGHRTWRHTWQEQPKS